MDSYCSIVTDKTIARYKIRYNMDEGYLQMLKKGMIILPSTFKVLLFQAGTLIIN